MAFCIALKKKEEDMAHHATMNSEPKSSIWASQPGYKPILLLISAVIFIAVIMMPIPRSMIDLVSKENPSGYSLGRGCKTIADTMNQKIASQGV